MHHLKTTLFVGLALLTSSEILFAQQRPQVSVQTPFRGVGDRFFEGTNTNWSVRGPNFFASFGGANSAQPPFGGYNPNAGLSGGFANINGPWTTRFNFNFSQGYSRSMTSTTPVITLPNGVPGTFINGVQRPFVTSLIPVVNNVGVNPFQDFGAANTIRGRMLRGEFKMVNGRVVPAAGMKPEPEENRTQTNRSNRNSTLQIDPLPPTRSERLARLSAEEAKQQSAAWGYYEKGQAAEKNGKKSVAKLYYQMARKRADGELKETIEERLNALIR